MIWIDVTPRAAREVRALAAQQPDLQPPDLQQRVPAERFGLRIAVDREAAGDVPRLALSLSSRRSDADVVLPRYGFDVLVHADDAAEVDGLRLDHVSGPQGSGFVLDRTPRPSAPVTAPVTAPEDADLAERVDRALAQIRPALRADGGDVELVSVGHGIAYVRLDGACSGCSAALVTLTAVVERAVVAAVPEVTRTVLVA
jgi:iron-sulfur cluster assembly protein